MSATCARAVLAADRDNPYPGLGNLLQYQRRLSLRTGDHQRRFVTVSGENSLQAIPQKIITIGQALGHQSEAQALAQQGNLLQYQRRLSLRTGDHQRRFKRQNPFGIELAHGIDWR
jgi:hypothetical protein